MQQFVVRAINARIRPRHSKSNDLNPKKLTLSLTNLLFCEIKHTLLCVEEILGTLQIVRRDVSNFFVLVTADNHQKSLVPSSAKNV